MTKKPLDPLKPEATLLVKLGSLAVHLDELFSPDGLSLDKDIALGLLHDPEVKEWLKAMDKLAFLPKKRW